MDGAKVWLSTVYLYSCISNLILDTKFVDKLYEKWKGGGIDMLIMLWQKKVWKRYKKLKSSGKGNAMTQNENVAK